MALKYDPEQHSRHSIRLPGYDYAQPGAYFVTVCTKDRECLFGAVVNREMRLNEAGKMIQQRWVELGNKFYSVETDGYVVMPNHFHGIIAIVGADLRVRPDSPMTTGLSSHAGAPLPEIVQWFKTMTTNEYIRGAKQRGWQPFPGRLWQRNYFEHIIRNEAELNCIRQYIIENPMQWEMDRENPQRRPWDDSEEWLNS